MASVDIGTLKATLTIETKGAVRALKDADAAVAATEKTLKSVASAFKEVSNQASIDISVYRARRNAIAETEKTLKGTSTALRDMNDAADPGGLIAFDKALEDAGGDITKMGGAAEATAGKTDKLGNAFDAAGKKAKDFSKIVKVIVAAAVIKVGVDLFNLGVEAEAWGRQFDSVFGDAADDVSVFVDTMNERFGVAEQRLEGMAAGIGALLIPLGFTREEAGALTKEVLTLAGALSEASGGATTAEQATSALTRGLLGQREALVGLGVKVTAVDVANRLAEKGMADLTGEAKKQAEALVTLELITGQATDKLDDFADGQTDAAEAQSNMRAAIDDFRVSLGLALIELAPFVVLMADLVTLAARPFKILLDISPLKKQDTALLSLLGLGALKFGAKRIIPIAIGIELFQAFSNLGGVQKQIEDFVDSAVGHVGEAMKNIGRSHQLGELMASIVFPTDSNDLQVAADGFVNSASRAMARAFGGGQGFTVFKRSGGLVGDWAKDVAESVTKAWGAFKELPIQVEKSLSEMEALLRANIAAKANWENNLATLRDMGFDDLAAEMEGLDSTWAIVVDNMIKDTTDLKRRLNNELRDLRFSIEIGMKLDTFVHTRQLSEFHQGLQDFWKNNPLKVQVIQQSGPAPSGGSGSASASAIKELGLSTSGSTRFFHQGGIVPGPPGANVPIVAQAGETVIPANRGVGGTTINFFGDVSGDEVVEKVRRALLQDDIRGSAGISV